MNQKKTIRPKFGYPMNKFGYHMNATDHTPKNPDKWVLRLYVAGNTPKSVTAFNNLKKICEEKLMNRYSIEVIDIYANPQLGREHQILALPTLVRKLPVPVRKIIGDLSNTERVLIGLDLKKDK